MMQAESLTDGLQTLFAEMDRLEARHQEALAFSQASERMRFLHDTLTALHEALLALRSAETQLLAHSPNSAAGMVAQRTRTELRSSAPESLLSPGRALIAADLDLLGLVAYTGAAQALVQERTRQMSAHIMDYDQRSR